MSKFKELQTSKNITNEQAAEIYNVSTRTITRWRTKEAPVLVLRDLESRNSAGKLNG